MRFLIVGLVLVSLLWVVGCKEPTVEPNVYAANVESMKEVSDRQEFCAAFVEYAKTIYAEREEACEVKRAERKVEWEKLSAKLTKQEIEKYVPKPNLDYDCSGKLEAEMIRIKCGEFVYKALGFY